MNDLVLKNFTVLGRPELELVLAWRNTERVRKMMSSPEPISLQDHLAYVASLPPRRDRRYYLVCIGTRPVGVMDYTEMTADGSTCNPGLYTGEGAPMGTGLLLELACFHGLFGRFGYREARSLVKKTQPEYSESLVRIFKAVKTGEDGENFHLLLTKANWDGVSERLMRRLFARFGVGRVVWREREGDLLTYGGDA